MIRYLDNDLYNRKSSGSKIRKCKFESLLQYLPEGLTLLCPVVETPGATISSHGNGTVRLRKWLWDYIGWCMWKCSKVLTHVFERNFTYNKNAVWLYSTESEWEGWRSWRNQARWWLQRDGKGKSSPFRVLLDIQLSSILRGEGKNGKETAVHWYLRIHVVSFKNSLLLMYILKQKM